MLTDRSELARRMRDFLDMIRSKPACELECQTLEVKGWGGNTVELSQNFCEAATCLANAEGGLVVLGVSNKKTAPDCFATCRFPQVNPDWVEERIGTLTTPPVVCRTFWVRELVPELVHDPEGAVIVVAVPKTSSVELHKFRGVCYKRKDNQCPIEYSTSADDYSDLVIPDAGPENVDQGTLEQVLCESRHATRYGIGGLDFLRNLGLIRSEPRLDSDRERLTIAGLLLLGNPRAIARYMPHAQVAFSYLGRSGVSESGRTETLNIYRALERFVKHLAEQVPLDSETLQEVIANALIHRDYRLKAITEITVSEDDIAFQNPGSLLAGLTPQNLIRAHPIYRNFRLAEAARQAGLCRKFGDGVDRIYYNSLSAGHDFPLITVDADSFCIRFSRRKSTAFSAFVRARAQALDNLDRIIVIRLLHATKTAEPHEIAAAMQRPMPECERTLAEMAKANMIQLAGESYRLATGVESDIQSFEPESRQLGLWQRGGPER
ncbi:MAG TPA: ATP-binding protein [Terriglobia bacterium]|nr:ATP-binding protein [Terriglobia bacterium]